MPYKEINGYCERNTAVSTLKGSKGLETRICPHQIDWRLIVAISIKLNLFCSNEEMTTKKRDLPT